MKKIKNEDIHVCINKRTDSNYPIGVRLYSDELIFIRLTDAEDLKNYLKKAIQYIYNRSEV
jgi:hypothetical protein